MADRAFAQTHLFFKPLFKPLHLVEANFRKPTGWFGRMLGHVMAIQHRSLTTWAIDLMKVRPGDLVLDVGCGGGMAVKLLAARAADGEVVGVDYSEEMVRQTARRNAEALRRGRVKVHLGNVMALPLPDAVFDKACAIETFYFWPDPVQGLREVYRVLKPGGEIAVALEMSKEAAAQQSPLQRWFSERYASRSAGLGLSICSGPELVQMLTSAGFRDARYDARPDKALGWLCAHARKELSSELPASNPKSLDAIAVTPEPSAGRIAPGPRGHLLLGSILPFKRDILQAMAAGQRDYGDVVRYRLGPVNVYGISHPEPAQQVFMDPKRVFGKLGPDNPLRLVLGEGLLTSSDHESWFRHRRMMQPTFHHSRITSLFDKMLGCATEMLDRWVSFTPGQTVDIHREMMQVTLDIVSQTMFSTNVMNDMDAIGPDAVNVTIEYAFQRLQNPLSLPTSWPTPRNRRFKQVMRQLDGLLYRIIKERRSSNVPHDDLLDMLLGARDEATGQGMSDKELRDEVVTTLAAGHETTAITLTWAWYLLSQHPEIAARMEREIDTVLGGRIPTIADLPSLPYTLQVFEESMRLYPSAPIIPRLTSEATTLGGYELPAGSRVLVNLFNLHRHPDFWPDAERFDPDRFAPAARKQQHRYAYLPFGAGPHLCIGKSFALMEAHLLLVLIAQRYRFQHLPGHVVQNHASITLRPRYGMLMTVHPRDFNAPAS
jgi:cytochrome P450/ubiquinone/menaquinone biosynthesis C-methylase UbiE